MITINFENANKSLCVICDKHTIIGRVTCSADCHLKFVEFCEGEFGASKKVIDQTTGIAHKVPTKDIIEKGLKWKDLVKYPRWKDKKEIKNE